MFYEVNRSDIPLLQTGFSEPPIFPNWLKVGLTVGAVVTITFAVLAGMNYLAPYSAIVAASLGIGEIVFIAIWYCCKKSQEKLPEQPLFNPPHSFETQSTRPQRGSSDKRYLRPSSRDSIPSNPTRGSSTSLSLNERRSDVTPSNPYKRSSSSSHDLSSVPETRSRRPPSLLHSPENWNSKLSHLGPKRANLVDYTNSIGKNTTAGFHPVPYIGNYDTHYLGFGAPYIQWKLPPSQLSGFPEEMQHIFGWYAEKGLLDLYFIGANDPGGKYLARNLVMHALALPEYNPQQPQPSFLPKDVYHNAGGIGTYVQMRIFEAQGIDPYPVKQDAIPFDSHGVAQFVNYHPGGYRGVDISPNNARFMIKKEAEYCSFYVGAIYRGRACAFFVVLTRTEVNQLTSALETSSNLMEFSVNLEGAPYKENIDKLLRSY